MKPAINVTEKPRVEVDRVDRRWPWRTRDAKSGPGNEFKKSRTIERQYVRQLVSVARHIGGLIEGFPDPVEHPEVLPRLQGLLDRYSETLAPWAESVARRMVTAVDFQDEKAWLMATSSMSAALRQELRSAPTGLTLQAKLAESVRLIKSLPTEAGERVHRLTLEGLANATRASEIAKEIARSGEVTASRATLIARTEVARTASAFTEARSLHIGSEGYFWRTSEDADVRPSHAGMAGKFVKWSSPPTLDGMVGHAGQFPNCRCYPEPVIPDA